MSYVERPFYEYYIALAERVPVVRNLLDVAMAAEQAARDALALYEVAGCGGIATMDVEVRDSEVLSASDAFDSAKGVLDTAWRDFVAVADVLIEPGDLPEEYDVSMGHYPGGHRYQAACKWCRHYTTTGKYGEVVTSMIQHQCDHAAGMIKAPAYAY